MPITPRIPFRLARLPVHLAIEFHNKSPLDATEVREIESNGVLATKLETPRPQAAEQIPRYAFRLRRGAPKLSCLINLLRRAFQGSCLAIGLWSIHDFDPLTRPAPADENAVSGPPSPPGGRGLMFKARRSAQNPFPLPRKEGGGSFFRTRASSLESTSSRVRALVFRTRHSAPIRLLPSPPWGRGWTASRVFVSGGGPGEGV